MLYITMRDAQRTASHIDAAAAEEQNQLVRLIVRIRDARP
jgi:hypothetical protein